MYNSKTQRPRAALRRGRASIRALALLSLGLFGCKGNTADVPTSECATGKKWIGGNAGSASMRPGDDCIECHNRTGGPRFAIAGTVYPVDAQHNADNCYGVAGATVVVADADGRSVALETNDAGNFYVHASSGPFKLPLSIEVEVDGVMRPMVQPATSGACGSCHTAQGLNAAPGRVIVPEVP